ncbi:MAG: sigma-54-dependent Fis family transcriptional regulator [Kiritimatiellae bacterium]|nr:sigma-54-dependent Fis family transcriptional regulator [Kiritimatiellia bacterium]
MEQKRKYELLGESAVMRRLRATVEKAAQSDAKVLITGESGTGKEVVARILHNRSPRAGKLFVAFNCANTTKDLVQSQLFGHEKGAFTSASERREGIFGSANGGTVFLDEIGELPIEVQGVLLRALETGCRQRIGGTEEIPCDVRLVAATNRNLAAMVREGTFRSDLYQRLNVVRIVTPPLRDHKEDIAEIASTWMSYHSVGRTLTDDQIAALMKYDYVDGNVRELMNLIDRALALDITDFDAMIAEHVEMNMIPTCEIDDEHLDSAIRNHVKKIHAKYDGNASLAARHLGISRNTLRRYLLPQK